MTAHTFTPAEPARWQDLDADGKEVAVRALATADGLSASAIAEILDTTRSAVLGLAHRRSIQMGADIPVTSFSARVARPVFALGRAVDDSVWEPIRPPTPSPTRKQCCWPVGSATGSQQQYCGAPRTRQSYCAHHAAIAFRPAHAADTKYTDMLKGGKVLCGVEPGITAEEALAVVRGKVKAEAAEE